MPQYRFDAYTHEGTPTDGSVFAGSVADAVEVIKKRGWIPTRVELPKTFSLPWKRVSLNQQVAWYSMLADLLASGMPIANSLELLLERSSNPTLSEATRDLRNRVLQGESLSQAMKHHPKIFDSLALYLIAAGEEGNFLELVLEKVSAIKDSKSRLISKLASAFAYPAFLLFIGSLVFAGMMLFFVPKFEPLFQRMREGEGLPWATEMLFIINHFITQNAIGFVSICTVITLAIASWAVSPNTQLVRHRLLLTNRILGPLVSGIALSRFCQVLASLLSSGVRIQVASLIAGQASGNRCVELASSKAVERLTAGESLAEALDNQSVFPREVIELIRMGERTNRLEKVLQTMSTRLEARNDQRLEVALRMLEPILMVIMASLIGFVMIALLMPIFNASGQSFN